MQRLDDVRMSAAKRARAKEQMRQAEFAVDLIVAMFRSARAAASRWKERLLPSADREREAYLSAAVDRVDLEPFEAAL